MESMEPDSQIDTSADGVKVEVKPEATLKECKIEIKQEIKDEPESQMDTSADEVKVEVKSEATVKECKIEIKQEIKDEPDFQMDTSADGVKVEVKPEATVKKENHQHPVERLGLDMFGEGSSVLAGMQTPAESRKLSLQWCMQQLVHACQCKDTNCRKATCHKMKRVVGHTRTCKKKSQGGCAICKRLVTLCGFHAKSCSESNCPVPFCQSIKQKLKQQQSTARKEQAHMLRRRMPTMITPIQNSTGSTPPSSNSGSGSNKLQHFNSQSSLETNKQQVKMESMEPGSQMDTSADGVKVEVKPEATVEKENHQHPIERLGLDMNGEGSSDSAGRQTPAAGRQTPAESRKLTPQMCVQQLLHACQCGDANCRQANCRKMKRVVGHTRTCKKKSQSACAGCRMLLVLCCFHATSCSENKCPVPFCQRIRQELKQHSSGFIARFHSRYSH